MVALWIGIALAGEWSLGESVWLAEGGAWSLGATELEIRDGYGFSVERDGEAVGLIFVGSGVQLVDLPDAGRGAEAALGAPIARGDAGRWAAPTDVAWALGAPAVVPGAWRRVAVEDAVVMDLSAEVPTVVVTHLGDLEAARATARELVRGRPEALEHRGLPLDARLDAMGADAGWGLLEGRTGFDLGRLAGPERTADGRWLTTVAGDPLAWSLGATSATVVFGERPTTWSPEPPA